MSYFASDPVLTVFVGSNIHKLEADIAWELWLEDRELVLVRAGQGAPGRNVGVFQHLGRWVFDPTDYGIAVVTINGEEVTRLTYLTPNTETRVEIAGTESLAGAPPPVPAPPVASPTPPVQAPTSAVGIPTLPIPPRVLGTPRWNPGSGTEPFGCKPPAIGRRLLNIGRSGLGADIEIDDPTVTARHATTERNDNNTWTIRRAEGAVWVDGIAVEFAVLQPEDRFVMGQTTLVVQLAGPPRPITAPPGRRGATVRAANYSAGYRTRLALDQASFVVVPDQFVAIVGPSGAGKSSLVKALLGGITRRGGHLSIDGIEVGGAEHRSLCQQMVRYVPQGDDSLYPSLTVHETLELSARLRLSKDTGQDERRVRVSDVLLQLHLEHRATSLVGSLSGGERRRVSIGIELLARPRMLLLDEPTSGLDQGKDRQVMEVLRDVAREGCTVICVTHAVDHLTLADQVLVMAANGSVAHLGPPQGVLSSLAAPSWADAMIALADPSGLFGVRYRAKNRLDPAARPTTAPVASAPEANSVRLTGLATLLRRQWTLILRRGPRSLAALCALPIGGTLIAVIASRHGLSPGVGSKGTAVLAVTATVSALTGTSLTYIDLLSEQEALKRDWRVGVPTSVIVVAKAVVFGVVSLVLAAMMFAVFAVLRGLPGPGPTGVAPTIAVALPWVGTAVASMGLGLFISTLAPTLERAVTLAAGVTIMQVVFNGTVFQIPGAFKFVSVALPARLGLASGAAWVGAGNARAKVPGGYVDPLWTQTANHVLIPILALLFLAVAYVSLAALGLRLRWRKSE